MALCANIDTGVHHYLLNSTLHYSGSLGADGGGVCLRIKQTKIKKKVFEFVRIGLAFCQLDVYCNGTKKCYSKIIHLVAFQLTHRKNEVS